MGYKLVVFDFDGTLANSEDWMLGIFNRMAAKHRFRRITDEEVPTLRGMGNRELLDHLGVQKWRLPWIARDARRWSAETANEIPLFEGVPAFLSDIAAGGAALAIVSSNSEATIRRVLGPQTSACISHYGCGAALFGKAKKLRKVVRRAGVAARHVLCVGDETRDIEAARAAGLASASVTWGYATAEVLKAHEPTLLVNTLDELAAAILA